MLPPAPETPWQERDAEGPSLRRHESEVLAFLNARIATAAAGAGPSESHGAAEQPSGSRGAAGTPTGQSRQAAEAVPDATEAA